MKKYLLILSALMLLVLTKAIAQKATFAILAGSTLANSRFKADAISVTMENKIGATAGVLMDIPAGKNSSFQSGLNFVQKGFKSTDDDYKSTATINYLEVPLNLVYKPAMPGMQFFAGAGPSVAFALSGKGKEKYNGSTETHKFKFGNNPDEHDLKRLDLGANFTAGIETKGGFLVALNYNLGFSNIAPGDSDDGTIKNRYFAVRLGYMLKNAKK